MCIQENGKSVCQGTCNGKPKENCPIVQMIKNMGSQITEQNTQKTVPASTTPGTAPEA